MVYVNKYLLFIFYVYSMSNENQLYNLKMVYIVYFFGFVCYNFVKNSSCKVYFLALYYLILKNCILVTLKYI